MKNLIKKILKESTSNNSIIIAGVDFTISEYISPQSSGKNDIFLKVKPEGKVPAGHRGGITPEKFIEINSIFKNVGLSCTPQSYNSDGNRLTRVYEIRIEEVELSHILKIYLETLLNNNTDTFFE